MKAQLTRILAGALALSLAAGCAGAPSPSSSASPASSLPAPSIAVQDTSASGASTVSGSPARRAGTTVLPSELDAYLRLHTTAKDGLRSFAIDRTETNEHALNGYFSYTIPDGAAAGRSFKLYMGRHAALRAYITVVAVPDGTDDAYSFLDEQGWIAEADRNGEILFVLEPKDGKWGSPSEEAAYLEACLAEPIGNDANGTREKAPGGFVQSGKVPVSDGTVCAIFTGHSTNYYVGYGAACAPLESWTSNNPLYVIAQAMIGGKSAGKEILQANAAREYNGVNTGSYTPGTSDDGAFAEELSSLAAAGDALQADFITNADIPVPTLLAGYAAEDESAVYWRGVNDCVDTAVDGVYHQALDSDAWQTLYANERAKEWGSEWGISAVALRSETELPASGIRGFLSMYTRYTSFFAYSNNLCSRLDYYPATAAARAEAEGGRALDTFSFTNFDGKEDTVELRALQSISVTAPGTDKTGTVYSVIAAFNDYDENGVKDPREYVVYLPDTLKNAGGAGVPLVVVFPGMTQAASTFVDCSGWWAIANNENCAVITVGEYCATNPTSLIYGDEADNAALARCAVLLMDKVVSRDAGIRLDLSRVYGSGHSLGCRTVQTLCNNTEAYYFSAVAATSFAIDTFTADQMPAYLFVGEADLPFILNDPWMANDPAETMATSNDWVLGSAALNGLSLRFTPGDHDSFVAACSESSETGRFHTYTWANADRVPVTRFTRTLAREHNCIPQEFVLAYDFLQHYSLAEDGTRYYSASAFAASDLVAITKEG